MQQTKRTDTKSLSPGHNPIPQPGALDGVRVLDLSRFIAGPYCAMLLGDMGADVIKIEPPGRGENSRAFGPFVEGESLYTMVFNRNKRSLTLDLRADAGKTLLRDLLRKADVLVENYIPGTLEKMGFDWDTLRDINARLIVTRISGFGQNGPLSHKPCFDVIAQTMSGLMDITGLYATIGTLGALQARQSSGAGQVVDVALLDSAMSMLMTAIPEQLLLGRTMTRRGNRDRYGAPANTFPTLDGEWVHLASAGEPMFRALMSTLGRPELADDPRFRDNDARMANVEALEEIIAAWTGTLTAAQLLDALQNIGVPSAKVARVSDLVEHPHLARPGQLLEMQHPKAGVVPMQGFSVRFTASPMRLRHAPPMLGQHTDEVLGEWLALEREHIEQLRHDKVV
jgi:crotonobetainyl-CoA:carnitine CoA-transferase CaiB-like acyl-CoA transferase